MPKMFDLGGMQPFKNTFPLSSPNDLQKAPLQLVKNGALKVDRHGQGALSPFFQGGVWSRPSTLHCLPLSFVFFLSSCSYSAGEVNSIGLDVLLL